MPSWKYLSWGMNAGDFVTMLQTSNQEQRESMEGLWAPCLLHKARLNFETKVAGGAKTRHKTRITVIQYSREFLIQSCYATSDISRSPTDILWDSRKMLWWQGKWENFSTTCQSQFSTLRSNILFKSHRKVFSDSCIFIPHFIISFQITPR